MIHILNYLLEYCLSENSLIIYEDFPVIHSTKYSLLKFLLLLINENDILIPAEFQIASVCFPSGMMFIVFCDC